MKIFTLDRRTLAVLQRFGYLACRCGTPFEEGMTICRKSRSRPHCLKCTETLGIANHEEITAVLHSSNKQTLGANHRSEEGPHLFNRQRNPVSLMVKIGRLNAKAIHLSQRKTELQVRLLKTQAAMESLKEELAATETRNTTSLPPEQPQLVQIRRSNPAWTDRANLVLSNRLKQC